MKSNWKLDNFRAVLKKSKSTVISLVLGLALGFAGGQAVHSMNGQTDESSKGSVKVPLHADESTQKVCPYHKGMGFSFSVSPWGSNFIRDSFFNDFDDFGDMPVAFPKGMSLGLTPSSPRVDTSESANEITITVDVPGIEEKDLDVAVSDRSITIKGEKKREVAEKEGPRSERFYGSFERSLSFPCRLESENAKASLRNGVLTIVIPKSQIAHKETKKLTIKTQ